MGATRDFNPLMLGGAEVDRTSIQAAGLVLAMNPNVFPGGGTLYERAGRGNHGTLVGATWATDRELGTVLSYSGTTQYVLCGTMDDLFANAMSMVAWIRPSGAQQNWTKLINRRDNVNNSYDFALQYDDSDHFVCSVNGVNVLGTTVDTTSDRVYCVAGTYDKATITIYRDGVAENTDAENGAIPNSQFNVTIGARSNLPSSQEFAGLIGEIRIYNRALSAAEIAAIYANPYDLWMPVGEKDEGYVVAGNPWWYHQRNAMRRSA